MTTTPFITKDEFGFYVLHYDYGLNKCARFTEGDLLDIKKAIDMVLSNDGMMVNVHGWNSAIIVDNQNVNGLYGCPASCVLKVAKNLYDKGTHRTVSVWQCVKTYGEDTIELSSDDEETIELSSEGQQTSTLDEWL